MEIKSSQFVTSSSRLSQCPMDGKPEYAFIGRSNVGKSSLINMLTGRKGLAMTSSTPGKTMLINHFSVNEQWYIVDLPGYGYAKRSKRDIEKFNHLISSYITEREQLTCLFVLIDSRLEPQKIDLEFVHFLGENQVPFAIVFTKADKSKPLQLKQNVQKFHDALAEEWDELPPCFITSSAKALGREEVLNYIDSINKEIL